ncbi:Nuclear factor NF-kappa-B p100 subunit [Trichoplax sp. H2]|nr:Nuclear factor NF-kappa-B p100 subunit [Trichoplax sp. H2]|eukprot:RDD44621.1 Nuclear factor NF-kappa-B p100 subunit [Trichoplax sp. H2]
MSENHIYDDSIRPEYSYSQYMAPQLYVTIPEESSKPTFKFAKYLGIRQEADKNLSATLQIQNWHGPVRIYTMLAESSTSSSPLPHYNMLCPLMRENMQTFDENGQFRTILPGETVSVIINYYNDASTLTHTLSDLVVVKQEKENKENSLIKNLRTFMEVTRKLPYNILEENVFTRSWSVASGTMPEEYVNCIVKNELKNLEDDKAKLMFYVEFLNERIQLEPATTIICSQTFQDSSVKWRLARISPDNGLSTNFTKVMIALEGKFNIDNNKPEVFIVDPATDYVLKKIPFEHINIIHENCITIMMHPLHDSILPKRVWIKLRSTKNLTLESNYLQFTYFGSTMIDTERSTIQQYIWNSEIGLPQFHQFYEANQHMDYSSSNVRMMNNFGSDSNNNFQSMSEDPNLRSVQQKIKDLKVSKSQDKDNNFNSGSGSAYHSSLHGNSGNQSKVQDSMKDEKMINQQQESANKDSAYVSEFDPTTSSNCSVVQPEVRDGMEYKKITNLQNNYNNVDSAYGSEWDPAASLSHAEVQSRGKQYTSNLEESSARALDCSIDSSNDIKRCSNTNQKSNTTSKIQTLNTNKFVNRENILLRHMALQQRKRTFLNAAMLLDFAKTNDIEKVITANLRYCAVKDKNGNTPLHIAIINHNEDLAIRFIQCMKKQPNLFNIRNNIYQTSLHLAANMGKSKIALQLVCAGACVYLCDRNGDTPLHIACRRGDLECVRVLLQRTKSEQGRIILSYPEYEEYNHGGNTPLHLAIKSGSAAIIKLFRDEYGFRLNIKEKNFGNSPLHLAVMCDSKPIAQQLIKAGADVNIKNCRGNTPLHVASFLNLQDMIYLLIEHHADVSIANNEMEKPIKLCSEDLSDELRILNEQSNSTMVF